MDQVYFRVLLLAFWLGVMANAVASSYSHQKCFTGNCATISQKCAYSGTSNPPPCTYCNNPEPTHLAVCGWNQGTQCKASKTVACGTIVIGALCSQHVCSGGTATQDTCLMSLCAGGGG